MAFEWLNEESRKILSNGYLLPGDTAENRIRAIADYAEKILGVSGFSDKFYNYMGRGWYSLSSPIWSNFGLKRGLPISCVSGETWINTLEDGGKLAKDIKIGDMVLTHKGRYKKVVNVIPTENRGDIYKLKVKNRMTNLYITNDHLVLTNLGWTRVDELNKNIHLVAINDKVEFLEEDYEIDLEKFIDYKYNVIDGKICKAVETESKKTLKRNLSDTHVTYYSTPFSKIKLDEELSWALGLWFAEGSLSKNPKKEPNGIRITLNVDEEEEAKKWLEIITRRFNLSGSYKVQKGSNGRSSSSWISVDVSSKIIGNFFSSFGNGRKEKTIPQWIINSKKNILNEFLKGILFGDGHLRKNTNKITLANPKMILQIYQIGLKLSKKMSLQMQEKPRRYSTTPHVYTVIFRDYIISSSRNHGGSAISFYDGLSYAPIETLEKTDRIETVYDFTVEEDHSFSAAGIVLHNCFGSYVEDSMLGIMNTAKEVGIMSKYGGGTSGFFGDVRPRGSPITDNGESEGSVNFMRLFNALIDVTKQGATRRGSFAAYLPIDHKDIEEFLNIKTEGSPIQNIFTGLTISDEWMKSMIDGDAEKRKVWAKVLQTRSEIGLPYLLFSDTVNRNSPEVYKKNGKKIRASNLCLSGDTEVEVKVDNIEKVIDLKTLNEIFKIKDVFVLSKDIVSGKKAYRKVLASAQTNPKAKVMKITDEKTGKYIICTPDHQIYTKNRGYVLARNLTKEDELNFIDE